MDDRVEPKVTQCKFGQFTTRPEPAGKLSPDLRGSWPANTPDTPADWLIKCPECNSLNVYGLDGKFNPGLHKVRGTWFCMSCREGWTYVREEEEPDPPPSHSNLATFSFLADQQKQAIASNICVWCQKPVTIASLSKPELSDYTQTATCPSCRKEMEHKDG